VTERGNVLVMWRGSDVTVVTSHRHGNGEGGGVGVGWVSVTYLTIVYGVVSLSIVIYLSGCSS
jgi:hypothetical protein